MKLFKSGDIGGFSFAGEKDLLTREADEAFHADDRLTCIEAIDRLYELLDQVLGNRYPRHKAV